MTEEILIEIRDLLKQLVQKQTDLPKLVYPKEITKKYPINLNKATELCKKYGTNFGGYCIETTKFQELLHNADINLFG